MKSLESTLRHQFTDPSLLEAALTHRSLSSDEPGVTDYERLEFLGDAVLQLAVTEKLFAEYPSMPEGHMAKLRAAVVNEVVLAGVGRRLGLGPHLRLGKGEETSGGRDKDSILSDVVEAILGAIYLDAGYQVAAQTTLAWLGDEIDHRAHAPGRGDFKTRLQELVAKRGGVLDYRVSGEGPDHDKVFSAEVLIDGEVVGTGDGGSKKAAQQEAARKALDRLG